MKYGLLLGLVAVVVVAGYLFVASPADAPAPATEMATESIANDQAANEPMEEADSPSGFGALTDFFGSGQSLYCTFSSTHEGGASEGEFWYNSERFRVEATTRTDGEVYTSNMISDGTRTYVWGGTAAGTQAMVFNSDMMEADTSMDDSFSAGQADARVDIDEQVEYDCQPWPVREAQFIPPSDIDFVDMEAMMQGMFEGELRGLPEGMSF
jgi:hypothetical protein